MFTPDKIHIDIETYSSVDLRKCGVHKYAASPDFEIMLVTIGYLGEDKRRIFETYETGDGDQVPADRLAWLEDPAVLKFAFNAMFERVCFGVMLGRTLDPAQWRCVMAMCGFAGLPLSLDKVTKVLRLENTKLAGTTLINYFAKPCKPTIANGGRVRNLPAHDRKRWSEYVIYNRGDVAAEWDVFDYIESGDIRIPDIEWEYYALDQRINDRGVQVDTVLANNAVRMAGEIKSRMITEVEKITGVSNARSVVQLLGWLNSNGLTIPDLRAETVRDALTRRYGSTGPYHGEQYAPGYDPEAHESYLSRAVMTTPDGSRSLTPEQVSAAVALSRDVSIERVLSLREQIGRTTVDKYSAALACTDDDGRARGLFTFNGAYRTGRFAGRRVQMQNLSRIHFATDAAALELARSIVLRGDLELFEMLYDAPISVLGELIRTVFIAPDPETLIAADYSAIEARVLAWLAGEQWKIDVFRTHGKIYEATASRMFGTPIESIDKGSDLRQQGKVGELAFGFGGSVGAVDKMGFLKDGTLTEAKVRTMVELWREGNPAIVRMWANMETAAMNAVVFKGKSFEANKCRFEVVNDWLLMQLPSGRELAYYQPKIKTGRFGKPTLWYMGKNDVNQWVEMQTYGGKLTENATQGVARDLLCHGMIVLDRHGFKLVAHVHDELLSQIHKLYAAKDQLRIESLLSNAPLWAAGLPLRADSFVSRYYKK